MAAREKNEFSRVVSSVLFRRRRHRPRARPFSLLLSSSLHWIFCLDALYTKDWVSGWEKATYTIYGPGPREV